MLYGEIKAVCTGKGNDGDYNMKEDFEAETVKLSKLAWEKIQDSVDAPTNKNDNLEKLFKEHCSHVTEISQLRDELNELKSDVYHLCDSVVKLNYALRGINNQIAELDVLPVADSMQKHTKD